VRPDAIDDDIRERPFEPFVNGRSEGTGLGLAIVRQIARVTAWQVRRATGLAESRKISVVRRFLKGRPRCQVQGRVQHCPHSVNECQTAARLARAGKHVPASDDERFFLVELRPRL
jgi:hypothetical protein